MDVTDQDTSEVPRFKPFTIHIKVEKPTDVATLRGVIHKRYSEQNTEERGTTDKIRRILTARGL